MLKTNISSNSNIGHLLTEGLLTHYSRTVDCKKSQNFVATAMICAGQLLKDFCNHVEVTRQPAETIGGAGRWI